MPAARKIAADKGLDPRTIEGTGRGGRVTKGDVLDAVGKAAQPVPKPVAPASAPVARSRGPTWADAPSSACR